jgi:hypothetical protein
MRSLSGLTVGKLKSSLRKFYCRNHDLINRDRIYLLQMTTDIFLLRFITGFLKCVTRRVPQVVHEFPTLPEYLNSPSA